MSEEPNNRKESTSINDLVEEVERLLREVEEKEELEEPESKKEEKIADELKEILEAPAKKSTRRKVEPIKEEKIEEPKKGRGRPKKVVAVDNVVTINDKIIGEVVEKKEEQKKKEKRVPKHALTKEDKHEIEEKKEAEIEKTVVVEKEIVEEENAKVIAKEVEKELITIKGESKEITITKDQLDKIEDEIRKQKDIPKQDRDIINKKIFKNLIIGVFIVLYFISINLGFMKLKEDTFLNDLRVFSGILIAATIFIFEKAYRKESIDFTILGIETLVLSIFTLLTNYIYAEYNSRFLYLMNTASMLFSIYYVGKSIISYIKMKKKVMKKISDIRNIINRSK